MAIVAAERENKGRSVVLENISHGQVQALSAVPSDNLVLATGSSSAEQEGSVVITPPPVREGRGVVKRFWNRVHVVPVHAGLFLFAFAFVFLHLLVLFKANFLWE